MMCCERTHPGTLAHFFHGIAERMANKKLEKILESPWDPNEKAKLKFPEHKCYLKCHYLFTIVMAFCNTMLNDNEISCSMSFLTKIDLREFFEQMMGFHPNQFYHMEKFNGYITNFPIHCEIIPMGGEWLARFARQIIEG